jgi:predicted  nucleic acid-binding Zn-ribbon protein
MGLFDSFFGKEEANQLKRELAEKTGWIARLESAISELKLDRTSLEAEFSKLQNSLQTKTQEIDLLNATFRSTTTEFSRVSRALELKVSQSERAIQEVSADREAKENELQKIRLSYEGRESDYQKREAKLAEKSSKLIQERLSLDTEKREIENLHDQLSIKKIALDDREADMIRRKCTDESLQVREAEVAKGGQLLADQLAEVELKAAEVAKRTTENDDRTDKLESWARELFKFRNRVEQLDDEIEKLKTRSETIDAKEQENKAQHSVRLAELRKERISIQRLNDKTLEQEASLKIREKELAREEAQVTRFKQEIARLRNELVDASQTIKSLEHAQLSAAAYRSKFQELDIKYKTLESEHESALKKAATSAKLTQENVRLQAQVQTLSVTADTLKRFDSALGNSIVLSWMLDGEKPERTEIKNGWVGTTGNGPWTGELLDSSLTDSGYEPSQLPHPDLEYVVVGRKGWSKSDLQAQIDAREGQTLWIYSQEMFFAKLATGRDPFESDNPNLLDAFAEDHPALQWLMSLPEPWPIVTVNDEADILEVDAYDLGVSESPLRILGYKVGSTSDLTLNERRKLLVECFESNSLVFSHDSDEEYISKWGRGGGAQRLYRMATHLKLQAEGWTGKRSEQARMDWIRDLEWLKNKYFPTFQSRFTWPG